VKKPALKTLGHAMSPWSPARKTLTIKKFCNLL
jgi:hypothetical protein